MERIKIDNKEYFLRDKRIATSLLDSTIVEQINDIHNEKEYINNHPLTAGQTLFTIQGVDVKYNINNEINSNTSRSSSSATIELTDDTGQVVITSNVNSGTSIKKVHPNAKRHMYSHFSPLYKKPMIVIGDSYYANDAATQTTTTWWFKLAQLYKMTPINCSMFGAPFVAAGGDRIYDFLILFCRKIASELLAEGILSEEHYNNTLRKYSVSSENELKNSTHFEIDPEKTTDSVYYFKYYDGGSENEQWVDFYSDLFKDCLAGAYVLLNGGRNDTKPSESWLRLFMNRSNGVAPWVVGKKED